MPGKPRFIYWDSSVFLSYLNADPGRIDILDSILNDTQKSNSELRIITSVITKVEVASSTTEHITRILSPSVEQKIDALWNDTAVIVLIEFYDGIALQSRNLIRQSLEHGWALKPADAIHLASAQSLSVEELHTYDNKMPRYSTMIGCKICEPYTTQLRLNLDP
jgi:predicted nucleic acid-binding protein